MNAVDPSRLCQIEIQVADRERAVAFYTAAFGWAAVPAELYEYVVLDVPPSCPFGMSLTPGRPLGATGGGVVPYFQVDDPAAVVAEVERHGGKLRLGPKPLQGYGEVYQVEDPDGNVLGLYKRGTTR